MGSQQKIKTAVIGVGYLGRFHAQKLKQIECSQLMGVFDVHAEQAGKVAAELEVKAFASLDECLAQAEAVVVATSTPYHADVVTRVLKAGRHVLVEKPITEWAEQAQAIVRLSEQQNKKIAVGQIERFNPCFQWLRENVFLQRRSSDTEKILAVELFRLAPFRTRGSDVSVVQDLLIHDVDLMLWLMGSATAQIRSLTGQKMVSQKLDFVQTHLMCEEVPFYIHVSRVAPQINRFARVITSRRIIEINSQTMDVQISTYKSNAPEPQCELEQIHIEKKDALFLENSNFLKAILGQEELVCSGQDGFRSLQLCEEVENALVKTPL